MLSWIYECMFVFIGTLFSSITCLRQQTFRQQLVFGRSHWHTV